MTAMTKRARNEALALARRNDRADKHMATMAAHAARKAEQEAAMATYNRYWSAWLRGGCVGPRPLQPR